MVTKSLGCNDILLKWKLLLLTIVVLSYSNGQDLHILLQGERVDSSFYHIEKISDNEFWVGGEYGILKAVDTLGHIRTIDYPNQGVDLIKIKKLGSYVYLLSADAIIYRYDIDKKSFLYRKFEKFKNRCFYDMIALDDGRLVVCGGTTGIAEGKKKIPNGFIASIDRDLNDIKFEWKHRWKFVWSLMKDESQKVSAVVFNGLKTRIMYSEDLRDWKKGTSVKGLVHEIIPLEHDVWYCGAGSVKYKRKGLLGKLHEKKRLLLNKYGCLWSVCPISQGMLGVTYSGQVVHIDNELQVKNLLSTPSKFALYDIEKLSQNSYLIVGRGKTILKIIP